MAAALRAIDAVAGVAVTTVASLYRTPPWGKTDQPDFLNTTAGLETWLSPHPLLDVCLEAERALKRVRAERWGPRVIDIDILWFDGLILNEPGLQVPHPRMVERAFVMVPLAEIAPDLLVMDGLTATEAAARLDRSGIDQVSPDREWWRASP